MAAVKCISGVLALLAVSAWTEGGVVRRRRSDRQEGEDELSIAEKLEKANRNLKTLQLVKRSIGPSYHNTSVLKDRNRNSIQINSDIVVPLQPAQRNVDLCFLQGCKWPKDKDEKVYIPYAIANHFFSEELDLIKKAMESFSNSTCIRFIPLTNQPDYIYIQSLGGCYSYVGRRGRGQTLSLNRGACIYHGIIQHELIHALGFNHEHSRSDRDQHIQVLKENIMPGLENNFKKVNTLNQETPYDYNSVMHYGRLAFSKNNISPTMVAIPNPSAVFGSAKQMSQNDINRINLLYCSQK